MSDLGKLDSVQPNQGWGELCVGCQRVFADAEKYLEGAAPEYPCKAMAWKGRVLHGPNLQRFENGTEICDSFASG